MDVKFKEHLRERAQIAGFLDARVASARTSDVAAEVYRAWTIQGFAGEMAYLERLVEERSKGAEHVLPGAKSVIVLAASYWFPNNDDAADNPGISGNPGNPSTSMVRTARYALGKDYHYVLKERLARLVDWLAEALPDEQWRICVDSAPLLERSYAAAAGLGFIGKNGMLISWLGGSYTFLCEIVTTAAIEPDEPRPGTCGQCTRCLDACPTQAFIRPGLLDARKCISYLTIEKKSELTEAETAATGEWVFGCDVCQDVCPYNKAPEESHMEEFRPGTIVDALEPVSTFLAATSNRQFERRFAASPILRAGKRRVQHLANRKIKA